jgi:hypothetical protein
MAKKVTINLKPRKHRIYGRRHTTETVKGPADSHKDFPFPADLETKVTKAIKGRKGKVNPQKGVDEAKHEPFGAPFGYGGGIFRLVRLEPKIVPVKDTDPEWQALLNTASVLQGCMIQHQFDEHLEAFFGQMERTADWGIKNLPQFAEALTDHRRQISRLRDKVTDILPKALEQLIARNPKVPVPALIDHAVQMIVEQLGPLLSLLNLYTAVLNQYRDGLYTRLLNALNIYMRTTFHLFQGGDLENLVAGKPSTPTLPTESYQFGDKIITGLIGPGLGTIPAAKGPVHLHTLMVPMPLAPWALAPGGCLMGHEGWHNIENDVRLGKLPMLGERMASMAKALTEAYDDGSGPLKLSSRTIELNGQEVPMIDFVVKVFTDWLSEMGADSSGGICFNGPKSWMHSMNPSFPAMGIHHGSIEDAPVLYPSESVYSFVKLRDGTVTPEFEAHPQPSGRAGLLVPAVFDEIGFHKEGEEQRALVRKGFAGGKDPDVLTWANPEGEGEPVHLPFSDVRAAASFAAKNLIRAKHRTLMGKSCGDIVMWDENRERKKRMAVDMYEEGKIDIKPSMGTMFPTYMVAAGADYVQELARRGELTPETLAKAQELVSEGIEKTAPKF